MSKANKGRKKWYRNQKPPDRAPCEKCDGRTFVSMREVQTKGTQPICEQCRRIHKVN